MPRIRQNDPAPSAEIPNLSYIELIPTFSGEGDVTNFLKRIEEVSELTGWSDRKRLLIAKLKLTGAAETFFRADPANLEIDTFSGFSAALTRRFRCILPLATQLQSLAVCVQKEGESVREYATRVRILGNSVFGANGAVNTAADRRGNDHLMQAKFVSGLYADLQRRVLSKAPGSFQEAIEMAEVEERNEMSVLKSIISQEGAKAQPTGPMNELSKRVEELALQVQMMNIQKQVNATHHQDRRFESRREPVRCFYCGITGHIKAECRKYRADNNRQNQGTNHRDRRNLNFRGRRQQ